MNICNKWINVCINNPFAFIVPLVFWIFSFQLYSDVYSNITPMKFTEQSLNKWKKLRHNEYEQLDHLVFWYFFWERRQNIQLMMF